MDTITGKTLIDWGFTPGPWFEAAVRAAEEARLSGAPEVAVRLAAEAHVPPAPFPLLERGAMAFHRNIEAADAAEAENVASVEQHMLELMRVPTARAGAIMPDACPSDKTPGTIPVGAVVATEGAIHPGMHSADICCSMAITMFDANADATALLDAGMGLSHFGGGGRQRGQQWAPPVEVMAAFAGNAFLKDQTSAAIEHFGTQGDGNHFFYVGRVASSGQIALVTHHGSRRPGAALYKAGMAVAERTRRRISPQTAPHNAWIEAETRDGEAYWDALQTIRAWTKASHFAIHDRVADALGLPRRERFWNEHNFVFRRSDGLFYHAKGATPAFRSFAADDSGLTLIPLNMAAPILIARGSDAAHGLGFAPHGAGRNFSRTAYLRQNAGRTAEQLMAEQTRGVDVRFFSGIPDASELPGAYKDAASMRRQITHFGLAEVVDTVEPLGSIMAGDWMRDAPWRGRSRGKAPGRTGPHGLSA